MGQERIRYERIIAVMRLTFGMTLVVALLGTVLPGGAGRSASAVAAGLVIAWPLLRVAWLAYRWWRWGDRAFASVAVVLLLVVGSGTLAAFLTR